MSPLNILAASAAAAATLVPVAGAQVAVPVAEAQDESYYVKVKPNLGLRVTPKRDAVAPYRYTAKGILDPNGAPAEASCEGTVRLRVRRGARTVARGTTRITPLCDYTETFRVSRRKLGGLRRGTLKVSARFGGNTVLQPDSAPNKKVKFG